MKIYGSSPLASSQLPEIVVLVISHWNSDKQGKPGIPALSKNGNVLPLAVKNLGSGPGSI